jgi:hypothetical protein
MAKLTGSFLQLLIAHSEEKGKSAEKKGFSSILRIRKIFMCESVIVQLRILPNFGETGEA